MNEFIHILAAFAVGLLVGSIGGATVSGGFIGETVFVGVGVRW